MDKWNLFYTKADEKNIRTTSIWHFNEISQLLPTKSQQQVTKHRIRNHESMKTVEYIGVGMHHLRRIVYVFDNMNQKPLNNLWPNDVRPTDRAIDEPTKQTNKFNQCEIHIRHSLRLFNNVIKSRSRA